MIQLRMSYIGIPALLLLSVLLTQCQSTVVQAETKLRDKQDIFRAFEQLHKDLQSTDPKVLRSAILRLDGVTHPHFLLPALRLVKHDEVGKLADQWLASFPTDWPDYQYFGLFLRELRGMDWTDAPFTALTFGYALECRGHFNAAKLAYTKGFEGAKKKGYTDCGAEMLYRLIIVERKRGNVQGTKEAFQRLGRDINDDAKIYIRDSVGYGHSTLSAEKLKDWLRPRLIEPNFRLTVTGNKQLVKYQENVEISLELTNVSDGEASLLLKQSESGEWFPAGEHHCLSYVDGTTSGQTVSFPNVTMNPKTKNITLKTGDSYRYEGKVRVPGQETFPLEISLRIATDSRINLCDQPVYTSNSLIFYVEMESWPSMRYYDYLQDDEKLEGEQDSPADAGQ